MLVSGNFFLHIGPQAPVSIRAVLGKHRLVKGDGRQNRPGLGLFLMSRCILPRGKQFRKFPLLPVKNHASPVRAEGLPQERPNRPLLFCHLPLKISEPRMPKETPRQRPTPMPAMLPSTCTKTTLHKMAVPMPTAMPVRILFFTMMSSPKCAIPPCPISAAGPIP